MLLMEETSKAIDQMDMTLVNECLYFLYPENEAEDRAYIERTLPILHEKLGFNRRNKHVRHGRMRIAMVAVLIVLGVMLLASLVAAAFGFNLLDFLIKEAKEYWIIHVKTPAAIETVVSDLPAALSDYEVWGEAIVQDLEELGVYPALPKMIPEGYEYVSTLDFSLEGFYSEKIYFFEHKSGAFFNLKISIDYHEEIDVEYNIQKELEDKDTIFHNGLEIALGQNYEGVSAGWISGNCRVKISGTCSLDDLESMIYSI